MSTDGSTVGVIKKEYAGFLKEAFTKADTFGISCKLNKCYLFNKLYYIYYITIIIIKFKLIY